MRSPRCVGNIGIRDRPQSPLFYLQVSGNFRHFRGVESRFCRYRKCDSPGTEQRNGGELEPKRAVKSVVLLILHRRRRQPLFSVLLAWVTPVIGLGNLGCLYFQVRD